MKLRCCSDLDNVLAYTTPALVRVQDRRLGLLRLFLVLCCAGYVFVWNVVIQGGWYKRETLEGRAAMTITNPSVDDKGNTNCFCYGGPSSPLCGNATGIYETCFEVHANFTGLPYCLDSDLPYIAKGTSMEKHRCIRLDRFDAVNRQGPSITVATTITYRYQSYNPQVGPSPTTPIITPAGSKAHMWVDTKHPYIPDFFGETFYVSKVGEYIVLLEHDLLTHKDSRLSENPGVLKSMNKAQCAALYGSTSKEIYETTIGGKVFFCDIQPARTMDCRMCKTAECKKTLCRSDLFKLSALLLAGTPEPDADALLISPLDSSSHDDNIPSRRGGFNVNLIVRYFNLPKGDLLPTGLSYYYEIQVSKGPPNVRSTTEQDWKGKRNVFTSWGMTINPHVEGEFVQFDPSHMLVQMTSTLTLLAGVTFVVEMVMLKLLPLRTYYRTLKYTETAKSKYVKKFKSSDFGGLTREQIIEKMKGEELLKQGVQLSDVNYGTEGKQSKNSWANPVRTSAV
jgi:hypothetical protein